MKMKVTVLGIVVPVDSSLYFFMIVHTAQVICHVCMKIQLV